MAFMAITHYLLYIFFEFSCCFCCFYYPYFFLFASGDAWSTTMGEASPCHFGEMAAERANLRTRSLERRACEGRSSTRNPKVSGFLKSFRFFGLGYWFGLGLISLGLYFFYLVSVWAQAKLGIYKSSCWFVDQSSAAKAWFRILNILCDWSVGVLCGGLNEQSLWWLMWPSKFRSNRPGRFFGVTYNFRVYYCKYHKVQFL